MQVSAVHHHHTRGSLSLWSPCTPAWSELGTVDTPLTCWETENVRGSESEPGLPR